MEDAGKVDWIGGEGYDEESEVELGCVVGGWREVECKRGQSRLSFHSWTGRTSKIRDRTDAEYVAIIVTTISPDTTQFLVSGYPMILLSFPTSTFSPLPKSGIHTLPNTPS